MSSASDHQNGQLPLDSKNPTRAQDGNTSMAQDSTSSPAHGRSTNLSNAGDMVTFIIGPDNQTMNFEIPRELACRYSPTLRDALTRPSSIGDRIQTYHMPHVDHAAFAIFYRWIYNQQLMLATNVQVAIANNGYYQRTYTGEPGFDNEASFCTQLKALLRLWVLAEELLIPQLANNAMTYLWSISMYSPWPYSRDAQFVWDNTTTTKPKYQLRRLLAYVAVYYVSRTEHKAVLDGMIEGVTYPDGFKNELLINCHRENMRNMMLGRVPKPDLNLDELLIKVNGEEVLIDRAADGAVDGETNVQKDTPTPLPGGASWMGLAENPFDDHVGGLELPENPFTDDAEL